jgi:peptidoglycan/LPS O-acetylase OafA/YrhL
MRLEHGRLLLLVRGRGPLNYQTVGTQRKAYIPELAGLDLLRFLLSITVMVFHYYFFYHHPGAQHAPPTNGPFQSVLGLVYKWGFFVVQVFWLLSGFIFYTVYFDTIQNKSISMKEYMVLRLSRLYPLHLLTLFLISALQIIHTQWSHHAFWYDNQDAKHFFLQLTFMQAWYPNFEQSFNVPAWSVSVEVFVYILFFLVVASGIARNRNIYLIFAVSVLFVLFHILEPFSRCMVFFFGGNIVAKLYGEVKSQKRLFAQMSALSLVAGGVLVYLKKFYGDVIDHNMATDLALIPIAGMALLAFVLVFRHVHSPKIVHFLKGLGDLTYATYMLHYSIIAAIVWIVKTPDLTFYDNDWMLLVYLGVTIAVSWLVFRYFEMPAQRYFRKLFYKSKTEPVPVNVELHGKGSVLQ